MTKPGGLRELLRGSAGIAVAMAVTNVGTYGFQMVAARVLGPADYGAIASMMAFLMVVAVLQLGLQATAARRISAAPEQVAEIEAVMLRATYRCALGLGVLLLVASPLVWKLLVLDSIVPALLMAVAAVPLTIQGGQAGILQGERRWLPLALLYLGVGVPRLVVGSLFIAVSPTETSAMIGVLIALFVPVLIGAAVLRRPRLEADPGDGSGTAGIARETTTNSIALLAFFVLSNVDIIVARNVLDNHDAGLYAGGLILTKAVLFLPQFVVIVAFPSMSTPQERRRALSRSVGLVAVIGVVCTGAAWLLSSIALIFVGGQEYSDVEQRLWLFAVLGTTLAMLQLIVYSVLARQGTKSAYLIWVAVAALIGGGLVTDSLNSLVVVVTCVDAVLFVVLLGLSLYRMGNDEPDGVTTDTESPDPARA